jgi:ribosomal protein S18 acetylase RimI-like enzyme
MRPSAAFMPTSDPCLRLGNAADIGGLVDLENRVFASDQLARRSFRRFIVSRMAVLLVAEQDDRLAGYALVLFRSNTRIARLYSLAVAPDAAGQGVGPLLLAAAEEAARARNSTRLRLEVREGNARAISRYRKSGYGLFGRHLDYYDDHGTALRFEKRLAPPQAMRTRSR